MPFTRAASAADRCFGTTFTLFAFHNVGTLEGRRGCLDRVVTFRRGAIGLHTYKVNSICPAWLGPVSYAYAYTAYPRMLQWSLVSVDVETYMSPVLDTGGARMARASTARTNEKWGKAVVDAGFTILPNHLVAINQFLDKSRQLTPTEMFVLLQVLLAWWSADRLPFPSKAAISARTGLSPRQVQRALASLEKKEFLVRTARFQTGRGRTTNAYDPGGLVAAVREMAAKQPNIFAVTADKNKAPAEAEALR